jgi:hypothetical protein
MPAVILLPAGGFVRPEPCPLFCRCNPVAILAILFHGVVRLEWFIAVVTIWMIYAALAGLGLRIFYGWGGFCSSCESEGWDCPSIAEVSACILRSNNRPKKDDTNPRGFASIA